MGLTWGASGQWCKMSAEGDVVCGQQRVRGITWYATGATAGTTLLEVQELASEAPITAAVAEAAQLVKDLPVPSGLVKGIKLSNLDAGHLMVYFEERPAEGVTAKGIHDASPVVPEE